MDFELRYIATSLAIRAATAERPEGLTGYAAVFGSQSEDLGGFREVISPGAFSDTLASREDVRALRNHDPAMLLGRTSSGTLKLAQDAGGLSFDLDVPDTSYSRDMMTLVKRGDVKGMSFGFNVAKGGDSWSKRDGMSLRTINKVKTLGEISVVDSPAYRATSLQIRSETLAAFRQFDRFRINQLIRLRKRISSVAVRGGFGSGTGGGVDGMASAAERADCVNAHDAAGEYHATQSSMADDNGDEASSDAHYKAAAAHKAASKAIKDAGGDGYDKGYAPAASAAARDASKAAHAK